MRCGKGSISVFQWIFASAGGGFISGGGGGGGGGGERGGLGAMP